MQEQSDSTLRKEHRPTYYTIKAGSQPFTGPRGQESTHASGPPLDVDVTAKVVVKEKVRGEGISFWVEVTSPPEKKGQRFWVAPRPGRNTGFY